MSASPSFPPVPSRPPPFPWGVGRCHTGGRSVTVGASSFVLCALCSVLYPSPTAARTRTTASDFDADFPNPIAAPAATARRCASS